MKSDTWINFEEIKAEFIQWGVVDLFTFTSEYSPPISGINCSTIWAIFYLWFFDIF